MMTTLWSAIASLMTMGCLAVGAQSAVAPASGTGVLSQAKVYAVDQLPVNKSANGTEGINVLRGALETGESVAVHESVQPVGAAPGGAACDSALGADCGA